MPATPSTAAAIRYRLNTGRAKTYLSEDGRQPIKGVARVTEAGQPTVEHCFRFDNCDNAHCEAKYFRGTAFTLIRTTPPNFHDNPDMPACIWPTAYMGHDGISVEAVDWIIDHPRLDGMRDHCLDFKQGNCHVTGGHCYGGNFVARVRPNIALTNIDGTQLSDGRICCLVQGNQTTLANITSQHALEHHFLIGARTKLSNITTVPLAANNPEFKSPIHFDFANRDDKDLGPLVANGSTLTLADLELNSGHIGFNVQAHMVSAKEITVSGPSDSTALVVGPAPGQPPPDGLDFSLTIYGAGVSIFGLGSGNRIDIRWHQTKPRIELPTDWNDSNKILFNGVGQVPVGRAA